MDEEDQQLDEDYIPFDDDDFGDYPEYDVELDLDYDP